MALKGAHKLSMGTSRRLKTLKNRCLEARLKAVKVEGAYTPIRLKVPKAPKQNDFRRLKALIRLKAGAKLQNMDGHVCA